MCSFGRLVAVVLCVKKNILLTVWLLLPITIVSLLMVWIFWSLDKDRLMADAVPIGAGAGDTGNANALGQWLAGRDPDEVAAALEARRNGRAIALQEWPGGVTIKVPVAAFGADPQAMMLVFVDDQSLEVLAQDMIADGEGFAVLDVSQGDVQGFFFYATTSEPMLKGNRVVDADGRKLTPIMFEPQIPDPNLQISDPMVVEVQIASVYEELP